MINLNLHKTLHGAQGDFKLAVDFNITRGEFVCVYGASGVGKTSLFRMLSGLLTPDSGQILVNDQPWFDAAQKVNLAPQQRRIGYVFQDYGLFPHMSVKEQLLFALDKGQDKQRVKELLALIELEDLQDRKPEFLSGGQRQRVALARALVREPELLLLDEPFSALDVGMRTRLQDYLLRVHEAYDLTTLLISHEISEVVKLANRVVVLEDGRIVQDGAPLTVFSNSVVSGKFQFTGEVVNLTREGVVFVVTVLIGANFVRVVVDQATAASLAIGNRVLVASKAFNPMLVKLG